MLIAFKKPLLFKSQSYKKGSAQANYDHPDIRKKRDQAASLPTMKYENMKVME